MSTSLEDISSPRTQINLSFAVLEIGCQTGTFANNNPQFEETNKFDPPGVSRILSQSARIFTNSFSAFYTHNYTNKNIFFKILSSFRSCQNISISCGLKFLLWNNKTKLWFTYQVINRPSLRGGHSSPP